MAEQDARALIGFLAIEGVLDIPHPDLPAALPDARGFPARMIVPGLFGFVSATKWLERIELTSYAARTAYWTKVEVRIDDGDWQPVTLAATAGIDTWRQWSFRYDGPAGRHSAQVRATDGTGAVQPASRTKVFPSGARGWHQIQFTVD